MVSASFANKALGLQDEEPINTFVREPNIRKQYAMSMNGTRS